MPLASSLSSTQKRAAAIQAEKEEQERRRRISLPRSCRSTTRVTRDSAKRRRASRAMSQERMNKQIRTQENDTDTDSKKENAVTSPKAQKKRAAADDAPILSPTPYWKVSPSPCSPCSQRSVKS